jgi:cytochrome c oxidase subunit 4
MIHDTQNKQIDGHPTVHYFSIFVALCVCTLLSVILDLIHLPKLLLVGLVLSVAVAKALFVMTYFMHLKFEGKWKFIVLAPTVILALGLVTGLTPDIGMRYYDRDTPQMRAVTAQNSALESDKVETGNPAH